MKLVDHFVFLRCFACGASTAAVVSGDSGTEFERLRVFCPACVSVLSDLDTAIDRRFTYNSAVANYISHAPLSTAAADRRKELHMAVYDLGRELADEKEAREKDKKDVR